MKYQIGDFSRICRLSIKTLRYYHEFGILLPSDIDHDSGYRYYDETALEKARIISDLRAMDFSLHEIKEILTNYTDDSELTEFLAKKAGEIDQKIARYAEIQKKISLIIRQEDDIKMVKTNNEIVIKDLQDVLIAAIRFQGKYGEIGEAFGKLMRYCGRYYNGTPFALYFDHDYKEENADIEACVPVKKEVNQDGIQSRVLKGGKALTIIHYGPYETIGDSYKVLIDHSNEHQIQLQVPSREIYLKGPGMILPRNPQRFVTEIQMII